MIDNQGDYIESFHSITKIFHKYFEVIILLVFSLFWVIAIRFGNLPLILPDKDSLRFILNHYIMPLIYAILIQIIILAFRVVRKEQIKYERSQILITFCYLPFILSTVVLHFNFKSWMPFINPTLFDNMYLNIDKVLPMAKFLEWISAILNLNSTGPDLYHGIFVLMFFLSFILHLTYDSFVSFRKLVVGTCLILLLGSITYWIAPAIGPFIIKNPTLNSFSEYQQHMYSLYQNFKETGIVPPGYFANAPAAMPSLHVANSYFFLVMAKRKFSVLAKVYVCFFGYIVIVAVGSGWHYFVDLLFGFLLSIIVIKIIDSVYDSDFHKNSCSRLT